MYDQSELVKTLQKFRGSWSILILCGFLLLWLPIALLIVDFYLELGINHNDILSQMETRRRHRHIQRRLLTLSQVCLPQYPFLAELIQQDELGRLPTILNSLFASFCYLGRIVPWISTNEAVSSIRLVLQMHGCSR